MGFLVEQGKDLAYLFGGIGHETFRGLQFAFRAGDEARSLGNVVQRMEVEQLCKEGTFATTSASAPSTSGAGASSPTRPSPSSRCRGEGAREPESRCAPRVL